MTLMYDGNELRLYQNGNFESKKEISNLIYLERLVLGNGFIEHEVDDESGERVKDKLDDFRLYNRALSDDEVKKLYEMGKDSMSETVDDDSNDIEKPIIENFILKKSNSSDPDSDIRVFINYDIISDKELKTNKVTCGVGKDYKNSDYIDLYKKNINDLFLQNDSWAGEVIYCKVIVEDIDGNRADIVEKSIDLTSKKAPKFVEDGMYITRDGDSFKFLWREAQGGVDKYRVYRSTTYGELGEIVYEGTDNKFIDDNLGEYGTTYYYTLEACNSFGCSSTKQQRKEFFDTSSTNKI